MAFRVRAIPALLRQAMNARMLKRLRSVDNGASVPLVAACPDDCGATAAHIAQGILRAALSNL